MAFGRRSGIDYPGGGYAGVITSVGPLPLVITPPCRHDLRTVLDPRSRRSAILPSGAVIVEADLMADQGVSCACCGC